MANVTELQINGRRQQIDVEPSRTLLSVLRDDLELTGCKYGCGEGRCGACTVLIDGHPTRSCTMSVDAVADKQIRTIEGLAVGDRLHPLQQAFIDAGAMQCGYCTPGMILSALGLLTRRPNADRDEIVRAMNGNLCRCGTYPRIVSAIEQAARAMKGGAP